MLALLPGACAVKGYELGWAREDRLSALLGAPLDGIAPCRLRSAASAPRASCEAVAAEINRALGTLGAGDKAPTALGAKCRADGCSYANRYERRDIGLAAVVPIYRKITLRTVRARLERTPGGLWRLEDLSVLDQAPPDYGPGRIGG
jgi:hypothetical protein